MEHGENQFDEVETVRQPTHFGDWMNTDEG